MDYHYVTSGKPDAPQYEIIWKGNLSNPVATCTDQRNAQKIYNALNAADSIAELARLSGISIEQTADMAAHLIGSINRKGGMPSPASGSNDWNRVTDAMPDDGIQVLCYIAETDDLRLAHHADGKWWDGDNIIIRAGITHWTDPTPPNV